MGLLDGKSVISDKIGSLASTSVADSTLSRLLRDKQSFVESWVTHCDAYLRVYLAVDDSDPNAQPPKDISSDRHNWAKSEFAKFFSRNRTYLDDLRLYLSLQTPSVVTNDAVSNLKQLLSGKTDNELRAMLNYQDATLISEVHKLRLHALSSVPSGKKVLPTFLRGSDSYTAPVYFMSDSYQTPGKILQLQSTNPWTWTTGSVDSNGNVTLDASVSGYNPYDKNDVCMVTTDSIAGSGARAKWYGLITRVVQAVAHASEYKDLAARDDDLFNALKTLRDTDDPDMVYTIPESINVIREFVISLIGFCGINSIPVPYTTADFQLT